MSADTPRMTTEHNYGPHEMWVSGRKPGSHPSGNMTASATLAGKHAAWVHVTYSTIAASKDNRSSIMILLYFYEQ